MLDINFWEIAVVGVVALVVLGPERLPKVARTAGHLFGRLQRYVATVKADLNREMEMSDLAKVKQEVQEAARAFEQSTQEHAGAIEREAREAGRSLEIKPAATPDPASHSQADLLKAQEAGMDAPAVAAAAPVTPVRTATPQLPPSSGNTGEPAPAGTQAALDFGIEPVRRKRA